MISSTFFTLALTIVLGSSMANAQSVKFGNNSSQYSNDGECDDRRFFGDGMASDLDKDDIRKDAADCKELYRSKLIQVWVQSDAKAATRISNINFGNNSSEWANDGECDDIRFEGPGAAATTSTSDVGKDKNDCRKMVKQERAFLRDYK